MKIDVDKFVYWLKKQIEESEKFAKIMANNEDYIAALQESEGTKTYRYIIHCITNNAEEYDWIEKG